jgi:hypothetical protein
LKKEVLIRTKEENYRVSITERGMFLLKESDLSSMPVRIENIELKWEPDGRVFVTFRRSSWDKGITSEVIDLSIVL